MRPDAAVIRGATVLAGERMERIDDAALVMAGERIAWVGPRSDLEPVPASAETDATGLVVVPGFIDAHVHIGFAQTRDVLVGGVTTVRDLGWPPEIVFDWVPRSNDPTFDGPDIIAAGPMLTAPGGYPQRAAWAPKGTGLALTSPEEADAVVDSLSGRGAAVIKVALNPPAGPVLDARTLQAIVTAAHERDLRVTGHITGLAELHKAIATGVDELAHMLMSNETIPDETLEAMVRAGMTVVPTLSVRAGADRATAIDNLQRFLGLGGNVVYGTDLGNEGPGPGIDALEVRALAEAGMTARGIVASATVRSALWLGLEDRGVLAEGKRADLVVLPHEALDDPNALTRVQMVFRRGRRVV